MSNYRKSEGSMQQIASDCNTSPKKSALQVGLSEQQKSAISLLLRGYNDTDVARELGINRVTVYRWRIQHPLFRSELSRQRRQGWLAGQDRLRSLIAPALDVVHEMLGSEDARLRMRAAALLLRHIGARRLAPVPISRQHEDVLDNAMEAAYCAEIDAADMGERFEPSARKELGAYIERLRREAAP